ncbi:MAG: carbohydrate ABC transporter permease, partial [Anaerolineales bacterium]
VILALPAAVLLIGLVAYPVLVAVRTSLYEVFFFLDSEQFVGLQNYIAIFRDPSLGRIVTNTLFWTVGSLVGQFGLGLIAALAINQQVRGIQFFRNILIMPYVVPVIAIALVWRWMLDGEFGVVSYALQQIGLIPVDQSPLALLGGAMPSVISASIWRGFPFAMLIYWAALQGIDQEQYDAAKVDGANTLQEFWYITLPNLRNATIVLLVLRGIWTITYFDLIWLITRGGPAGATETWPIWIYQQAMGLFRFGYASAIGIFMGVLLLILVVIYVRKSNFGSD